jgi:GT2 family glycosyltransferase
MSSADIIIPAYNNAAELHYTLPALFGQAVPLNWSVRLLLSDDGSHDETIAVCQAARPPAPWQPTLVVTGAHGGSAAARNRALEQSLAHLVIFLGADIVLRPGALAAHLQFHDSRPDVQQAALGMIRWDPRLHPSPLMEWMMHGGGQNDFDALLGQLNADPRHFLYGSHLSLKRAAVRQEKFPEAYRAYGWEDLDLGRRLAPHLKLHILPQALALHRHAYTPASIWRRQRLVGRGLVTYQQRYPEVSLLPRRSRLHSLKIKLFALSGAGSLLRLVVSRTAVRWATPRIFSLLAAFHLWQGVYDTLRKAPVRQPV